MKILVFDTETADKAKDFKIPAEQDLNNYPYLIQLGARLVDYDRWKVESKRNKIDALDMSTLSVINEYIFPTRLGEDDIYFDISVSEDAEKVHGISDALLVKDGVDITALLAYFQKMVKMSDVVVAHNMNFDRNVMVSEYLRSGTSLRMNKGTIKFCTMLGTVDILKIPGNYGKYKWASLQELHQYCFNTGFKDGHNALIDVDRTMECVLHLLDTKQITF